MALAPICLGKHDKVVVAQPPKLEYWPHDRFTRPNPSLTCHIKKHIGKARKIDYTTVVNEAGVVEKGLSKVIGTCVIRLSFDA